MRVADIEPPMGQGVLFILPGSGVEYAGMGRALLAEEPAFARAIRDCDDAAAGCFERPLHDFLSGAAEQGGPGYRPAALAAFCIGTAAALAARGVQPRLHLGCSVGEIAALVMSGTISPEHAFVFIAAQAEALARHAPAGTLLFALGPAGIERQIADWPDAALAGIYAPGLVLVAVTSPHAAAVTNRLEARGATVQRLPLSKPVHSPLIEGARTAVLEAAGAVAWRQGAAILSAATMRPAEPGTEHLWRICREPIHFCAALRHAAYDGIGAAIDIGPSGAMATAARRASQTGLDCAGFNSTGIVSAGIADSAGLDRAATIVARHRH